MSERRGVFVRMFGSAILMQALLSATNFLIGLILIRRTSNADYGYFVLITNTSLLISGLQTAFIQPPMVMRMATSNTEERANLIGGLFNAQRTIWISITLLAVTIVPLLWWLDAFTNETCLIALTATTAVIGALFREFFRSALLAYRQSPAVLKADVAYVVILLIGIPLATLSSNPAAYAILSAGIAGIVGGFILTKTLWRFEPWNPHGPKRMLLEMAPLGKWSALGSGTHWAFSQGYNYVVAAMLEVAAIAALSATRLLMMPINLLSSGISSLMMPTATGWLQSHGPATLFRRLLLIASGLGALASCYFVVIWFTRDLIFSEVMHKHFDQSAALVLIWSAVFLVTVFRDQLQFLPGACGLYRPLTGVTAASAGIGLGLSYFAIKKLGSLGAPVGVLVGEIANVAGIVALSLRQIRKNHLATLSS